MILKGDLIVIVICRPLTLDQGIYVPDLYHYIPQTKLSRLGPQNTRLIMIIKGKNFLNPDHAPDSDGHRNLPSFTNIVRKQTPDALWIEILKPVLCGL